MASIAARTETAEQRSAIYEALLRRNRLVGILRIGVPAMGAVLILGLLLQIYVVSDQLVIAEGATEVKGSSGVNGTVDNATVDVLRERLVAGKADLSFDGGTRLEADTMSYDGKSKMWIFSNATLMFNTTPGATEYEARSTATESQQ
jgi:hypothetical protein